MTAPIPASLLASHVHGDLIGPDLLVVAPASIDDAEADTVCFATDFAKYEGLIKRALALGAVVLLPTGIGSELSGSIVQVQDPRAAFAQILAEFFTPVPEPGIAASAVIHPSAQIHPTARIGEFTVVREGVVVGARSEIRDHVVLAANVRIGTAALVKSHAVIGEEGFGMVKDLDGNNFRIPHLGGVHIGDHVEIGCFTTVCAGTIKPTLIGDYSKIDDHVHVAHNCRIERNVIITACAEVSGSVVLEDQVWLGPNSSIIQGVTLGAGSLLGIGAVALKSIPEGEVRVGNPARALPAKNNQ